MDPQQFVSDRFGTVIKTPGKFGFHSYVPEDLPRAIDLAPETIMRLSEADTALGRLAGAGRLLPNPHILVQPYVTREAVASARIEGTQASLSDVFEAAATGERSKVMDIREVQNYISALNQGLALLEELPLSLRLVRNIHRTLMHGVRGEEKNPGEFRSSPNWIGSPDNKPDTATFVPPPHDMGMNEALSDWERFLHDDMTIPVLVRCGLMHYQFETIHPFLDGNGRIGRLLIVFFLVQQERLPQPLLYISPYFEQSRSTYYERLQAVREEGDIQAWLRYFLEGVATQAIDAVSRAEQLADLREKYRQELAGKTRSRAPEVVDLALSNPILTSARVANALDVTSTGALNLIRQLEDEGWVRLLVRTGRGGRQYWIAHEVMTVVSGESPADATAA